MIISLANIEVQLLPEKAIWIPSLRLLCVADMHFEKSSFYEANATFLPPYGSMETLEKLQALCERLTPAIFVAAGDSFHDKDAINRMSPDFILRLNQLTNTVAQWHWLSGNHDAYIPPTLAGLRSHDLLVGGVMFRHQTMQTKEVEISGHYHPKVRLNILGHTLSMPCFVHQENCLMLPSFGQYTGGLDIDSTAFKAIAPVETRKVFVAHQEKVFAI